VKAAPGHHRYSVSLHRHDIQDKMPTLPGLSQRIGPYTLTAPGVISGWPAWLLFWAETASTTVVGQPQGNFCAVA
jgi:hypothetical protein